VDIEASKPASSTPIRYDTMMSVTTAMTTTTVRLLVSDTIWVLGPIGIPSVDASVLREKLLATFSEDECQFPLLAEGK